MTREQEIINRIEQAESRIIDRCAKVDRTGLYMMVLLILLQSCSKSYPADSNISSYTQQSRKNRSHPSRCHASVLESSGADMHGNSASVTRNGSNLSAWRNVKTQSCHLESLDQAISGIPARENEWGKQVAESKACGQGCPTWKHGAGLSRETVKKLLAGSNPAALTNIAPPRLWSGLIKLEQTIRARCQPLSDP